MGTWRLALLLIVMVVVLTEANRSRQRDRFRQRDKFRPRHTGGSDQEKSGNSGSKANSQDVQRGSGGGGGTSDSLVDRNRARNRQGEEGGVRRARKGQDGVPEHETLRGVSRSARDRFDRRDRHRHRHSRRRRITSTSTPGTPALAPNALEDVC